MHILRPPLSFTPALLVVAVQAVLGPMAFAQTGTSSGVLEVVTVTAQRVEQDLQDVPISITAVSGDDMQIRQIDSFDQLQYVLPGITFNAGLNARQSATSIRGIGTGLFNIGIEASTAVAIDGVILGREGAGIFDFADIERVEVLRGPQGTLFGKNASAGVISLVTKGPTDEFEGTVRASYGSFDEINLYAAVSGPLSDSVSGRISTYSNKRDGYVDNVFVDAPQSELNERDEMGVRGKLRFDWGDAGELLLSADFQRRDEASGALTYRATSQGGPGTGLLGVGVPVSGPVSESLGIVPGPNNLDIGSEGVFSSEMESWGASAEYTRALGEFDLVSLTAYREWDSDDSNDADLIPQPFLEINSGSLQQEQFSQEFRLVSPRNSPLTYTLGAYFFSQEMSQTNTQFGTAGLDLLGALPAGLRLGTDFASSFDETNMAIFGQGEYALTDKLSLIAGTRVLYSEVEGDQLKTVTPGAVGPFAGQNVSAGLESASEDDTAVVWRLGLQYLVDNETNLFATLTRGYKSAGIVQGLTINPIAGNQLPTVDAEIPAQFELGLRHRSPDGRLTTNVTAFYTQIDDFQAQTLIPDESGLSVFTVANAGEAESYGFEAELTWVPFNALTLSSAVAYTKAEFDDFPLAPCYTLQTAAEGCVTVDGRSVQDLAGQPLANAPEWVVNALARYDFTVASHASFIQLGAQYRDEVQSSITNDPNTIIDDRILVDAQLGTSLMEGDLSLSLFVRNLLEEEFPEAITGMPFDTGGYAQFRTLESERTVGATVQYSF
ncbi:MAG: TonB-dependent receptor [Halieaceae bacterium]|uniref:TonB-dependent receptor n=1 Tax=Haliea alexandrii TaxID=2448162 RepID=UPI000F0B721C|nr:TonB-dependent receptor [Haliea alexandrii]MCR9184032.1 TonB-dependent receptor [Halieaceae bacterium]